MKLFSYEMSDKSKKYDFYMTNAAKVEIEDDQFKKMESLGENEGLKIVTKSQRLNVELSKAQTDEEKEAIQMKIDELQTEMLSHISELSRLDDIDIERIPYVLLKNHRANYDMSEEEYGMLLDDMEETLGFKEFNNTLIDIADKVFTLIREVNDHKKEVLQVKEKPKMEPPLS